MFTVRELGVFIYVYVFHRAIGHMMSCLLYPLITFVLLLVCVAYWGTTALYPFTLWICICGNMLPVHLFRIVTPDLFKCSCKTKKKSLVLNAFLDI